MTELKARIHFSYHPSNGTPEGDTYKYLLRNELFDCKRGKALANQAITAWWLPYAWRTEAHARAIAIDCIEQLEQHIAKLRRDFQISAAVTGFASAVSTDPSSLPNQSFLPIASTENLGRSSNTPEVAAIETVVTDESLYATFDVFEED